MSRLSRYRRGSLVPHLIASTLLLAGSLLGAGGYGDETSHGALVARASVTRPPVDGSADDASDPASERLAVLDSIPSPGPRTYLGPNRPNPFSESTTIEFSLASMMTVTLKVYDFWYGEVETLIDNQEMGPGSHVARFYVGATATQSLQYSGMYFYELRAGDEIHQRRMLIVK